MLIYAREMGDEEVAGAIVRKLARNFERIEDGGIVSYKNVSTRESSSIIQGLLMRGGDVSSMVHDGPPAGAMRGPLLSEAEYPQVLVAKAFSNGEDLNLVLYAGLPKKPQQTIGLSRLQAGRRYTVRGVPGTDAVTADASGNASLAVELKGRTEIVLSP